MLPPSNCLTPVFLRYVEDDIEEPTDDPTDLERTVCSKQPLYLEAVNGQHYLQILLSYNPVSRGWALRLRCGVIWSATESVTSAKPPVLAALNSWPPHAPGIA